ncbi:Fic family protein [Catellatospora sp. TT07R-123]|uniref:Fic family protein n=1 Tax=Catellatospora sp. TT07R-123 TaxID=2733863 RepID=UPI001BB31C88|nr:Fic family protein [Catellatospora sp. TT07R-123]
MHGFSALDRIIGQVPARLVSSLRTIDIGQGSEALYRDQLPGVLATLARRARVASVTASSEIEGVIVPDQIRAENIIEGRTVVLRTRSEQELAGYRDALDYLFQQNWRPLNVGLLLHLHRLLFGRTAADGGRFKQHDNVVVDRAPDGSTTVRFRPVAAARTEFYVHELVSRFRAECAAGVHHPVLLIGLFVLDLTIIHPFEDGNGRVARVITNALLADAGYGVVRYVSLEQLVADAADEYYQALFDSTKGWHDNEFDPWPWLTYFVATLARAYEQFAQRAAADRSVGTKQDRVREYVQRHAPAVFRVADIRNALPGVSDPTIRLVLDQLRTEGVVIADGAGRTASWRRS